MTFAAVILAAGTSRRMGSRNKLLLEANGMPIVSRVLEAVQSSRVEEICVVLGHEKDAVQAVLEGRATSRVRFVTNPEFQNGLASSLVFGLANLAVSRQGIAICLGDMPFVTAHVIDTLCGALGPEHYAAVPVWQGRWGNPVVLSREAARDAMTLTGDRGARVLLRRHAAHVCEVPAPSDAVLRDIDRRGDLGLS